MTVSQPAPLSWRRVCYAADPGPAGARVRAERVRGGVRIEPADPAGERTRRELAAGVPVVTCLGVRESFVRRIEAPLAQAAKARRVLPTLLDIDLPFAIEDCVYDFAVERGAGAGKLRALAYGARRADVQRRVAELAPEGLDPAVMDQEGLALWTQAAREAPPAPGAPAARAVIRLGTDAALVVGRQGQILGVYALRAADAAAHIGQVLRSLFDPGTPVERIWAGADAADDARRGAIEGALARDWPGAAACVRDPALFRVRAIAHRALCGGPLPCNLLAGDLAHPLLRRRAARRGAVAAWACLAAGAALLIANVVWQGGVTHRERALDLAFASLASELAGYPMAARGEHAIGQVRQAVETRRAEAAPIRALLQPSAAADVAAVMAVAARADVRISRLAIGPAQFVVTGDAGAWNGPEALLAPLRARGGAPRLNRSDAGADGRIPFTIEGEGRK